MGVDPCVAPVDSLSSDQERDRQKTHCGKQYVVTPSSEQSNHHRSPIELINATTWCRCDLHCPYYGRGALQFNVFRCAASQQVAMFINWLRVKRRIHATTLKDLVRNGRSALKEGAPIAISTLRPGNFSLSREISSSLMPPARYSRASVV